MAWLRASAARTQEDASRKNRDLPGPTVWQTPSRSSSSQNSDMNERASISQPVRKATPLPLPGRQELNADEPECGSVSATDARSASATARGMTDGVPEKPAGCVNRTPNAQWGVLKSRGPGNT